MTATDDTRTAVAAVAERPGQRSARDAGSVIALLSSMKVTVVLLLLLGVVTFAGTLAQGPLGLYEAQRQFFESWFVVWDTGVALFGLRSGTGPMTVHVPLPGGYLLMILLFVNLVVGGVVRHRWTWRNGGILVTHLGIGLLLIAGFVKLHWSYSGHVSLFEGRSTRTMVSFHDFELALLQQDGDRIVERVVPASALAHARDGVVTIAAPDLPFTVEVTGWLDNCMPRQKGPMFAATGPSATDADGTVTFLQPVEVAPERERNLAGCVVKVIERVGLRETSAVLHGIDLGAYERARKPFTFEVDDKTFGLDLRRVVWDLPIEVRLDKFEKTDHPGTMSPRDFSSWVTVREGGDPSTDRQVHIYMNHPLRSHDHVFFQTNWGPQPGSEMRGPPWYSVFEVAKNPSDAWPKYASYVVLLGLLWHFVGKLRRYLGASGHRAAAETIA